MLIAQVAPRYYPYIGGVETVVKEISERMVIRGHQVQVLTLDPENKLPREEKINGVKIKRFYPTGMFYYSKDLIKYLRKNADTYNIIHAHSLHTFIPHMVYKTAFPADKQHLVLTGYYHGRAKNFLNNIMLNSYRPLIKHFLPYFNRIIAISNYEANLISQHFNVDSHKIKVIPVGVNIKPIQTAQPYQKEEINLLIVSRLEEYKNIQYAINAIPYLPWNYHLIIIGEGSYRKKLEQLMVKLKITERVKLLGYLNNNDVFRWYKTCDLVLNFSNLESFGLTVIEGLAAGKPVLVNRRTALIELAQCLNGVYAVDANKAMPQELANTIKHCIQISNITNTPNLDEYCWESITKRLLDYYIR